MFKIENFVDKDLSGKWKEMLGQNWVDTHERYLHTLGNLTLTGYNSELGDKPFSQKKDLLVSEENPTHIKVLYSDVLIENNWNERAIRNRAGTLCGLYLGEVMRIDGGAFNEALDILSKRSIIV